MTLTRLSGRYVIGYDGTDHVTIRDGCVVYQDSRIVYVGSDFPGAVDVDRDFGNAIIGPGFIDLDALADIDHSILDTWSDAEHALGFEWSEEYAASARHHVFTSADRLLAREFALRQLLLNGVTTAMPIAAETHSVWAETYDDLIAMADVAERLGIRTYLGSSFRDGVNVVTDTGERAIHWEPEEGRAGFEDALRLVRDLEARNSPLVRGCLLPCRIETQTIQTLRAVARAASELDCPVRIHALQSVTELEHLAQLHASSPVELLESAGLLSERLLVPHMFYLGGHPADPDRVEHDLSVLASHGVTLVHCPVVAMRVARPLDSFGAVRGAGLNIALGTDTFPPDVIRNLDAGVNLAKVMTRRTDAASPADLYRAATLGGARALGREDLGRLTKGALADIVVVDLDTPRVGVVDDPIRTMVANCSGAQITTCVVHGRLVVDGGATVDGRDAEVRSRAQGLFDQMREAYPERDHRSRTPDVLFPPSFPSRSATPDPEKHPRPAGLAPADDRKADMTSTTTPVHLVPASAELLRAAAEGDVVAAAESLRAGADLEARDERGRTPLLLAALNDHIDVAEFLVKLGADPDALDSRQDTPWLVTGVTGSVAMLETLLPARPDLTIVNRFGGVSIIPASKRGHVEYVRRVVETDIDVNHVNSLGWTALMEAVLLSDGGPRHQEILRILLAAGADRELGDNDGRTPLDHARARGWTPMIEILEP